MAKVIALIPARSGSKGVPNKNTRLLGGHPLIEWSIIAARKAKQIDRVIVSTDSREYAELSIRLGAEAPFLRPTEISGDRATDYDFVAHALNWLEVNGGEPAHIVHLRPTTPFRNPDVIDDAIRTYQISHFVCPLSQAPFRERSSFAVLGHVKVSNYDSPRPQYRYVRE